MSNLGSPQHQRDGAQPHGISRALLLALLLCTNCFAEVVIPIEAVKGNPVAKARINGIDVSLVIDSAGGVVALRPETLRKVAAAPTGSTRDTTDALGNNTQQALFTLRTLELGSSTFSNIAAAEMSKYAEQAPGEGIVGRDLLNRFVAVYDYASRKITLFNEEEREAAERECRGTNVSTVPDPEGIIVTMAQTDQQPMRMLWDTGAVYSFVKKTFADEHQLPVQPPFYKSQRFMLGPDDFGPLEFVVLDIKAPVTVDGYVGYNFFAAHVVCIDPIRQTIRVQKNRRAPADDSR